MQQMKRRRAESQRHAAATPKGGRGGFTRRGQEA